MFVEFKHTLRRNRGAITGWGIGLLLYSLLMSSFYSSILDMGEEMVELLESYPPEMMAFFPSVSEFTSPKGYLDTYYFGYLTVIIGIFVVSVCSRLIIGDEEEGRLDLIAAYPISRSKLFWSRLFGFVASLVVILFVGWLGWFIPSENSGLELSWLELLKPFLPLLVILVLFGTLTVLFSMLVPAARLAGGISGALLVGNFLLVGLKNLNEDLEPLYELTPFNFYQGGSAIEGINWEWLLGLLGTAIIFALIAWWRYLRRDIRVGGEGGWQFATLLKSFKRKRA